MQRIAYFVTPHGFGHAARAAAIMNEVSELVPSVSFDIYSTVPQWFFQDSIVGRFDYFEHFVDVGLVQTSPFAHDVAATITALERFVPFNGALLSEMAGVLLRRECRLVVCDIAALGIAAAAAAQLPSVVVENFTWDWIYEDLLPDDARFAAHVDYFNTMYQTADHRIQTFPLCRPQRSDLTVGPISRRIRRSSEQVRDALGIGKTEILVLLTTGGLQGEYPFLADLAAKPAICFVIPGAGATQKRHGNLILLPHRSEFFHPDLVNAADAVIGKAGYSTIAEVYRAGVPFGYVPRPNFREMDKLVAFIEQEIAGVRIDAEDFLAGKWLRNVGELLDYPRVQRSDVAGAQQAAGMIADMLN
jgi:hypothetical protein